MFSIFEIFTKHFFFNKKIYDNTNSFIYKNECIMVSTYEECDVAILNEYNDSTYIPEVIFIINNSLLTNYTNYYTYTIYDNHVLISLNKGIFKELKDTNAREYVCLSLYILYHNLHNIPPSFKYDCTIDYLKSFASNKCLSNYNIPNINNKRCALLLYGLPRTFEKTYPFIYNEWIKPYNCDIYISTEFNNLSDKNRVYELYKPCNVYDVSQDKQSEYNWLLEKEKNIYRNGISSSQFYKILKGGELIDSDKYDVIIVMRMDIVILRMEDIYHLNTIHSKKDIFYIIPSNYFKNFYNIGNILYNYKSLLNLELTNNFNLIKNNGWENSPENQMFQHLVTITNNNWKFNYIPVIIVYRDTYIGVVLEA